MKVLKKFPITKTNDGPVEFCNCGNHKTKKEEHDRQSSRGYCIIT